MNESQILREYKLGPCRILYNFRPDSNGYPYVHIGSCKVEPEAIGKGKFRAALTAFVLGIDAAQFKIKLVAMPDTDQYLDRLVSFYKELGFVPTGNLEDGRWPEMERVI